MVTKSQLESLQQIAGREKEKQQARFNADQERARQRRVWDRVRGCGMYEGLEGKLSAWEDGHLWPTESGVVQFGVAPITYPKVGSKEWLDANLSLCAGAVTQAWLPAARLVAEDPYASTLHQLVPQDEASQVVMDLFRRLVSTIGAGTEDEAGVVLEVSGELAAVRVALAGGCGLIGRHFCWLADQLAPQLTRAAQAPSTPARSGSLRPHVTAEEIAQLRNRLGENQASIDRVLSVLSALRSIPDEFLTSTALEAAGLPRTTVFGWSAKWRHGIDYQGMGKSVRTYRRTRVEQHVLLTWGPRSRRA